MKLKVSFLAVAVAFLLSASLPLCAQSARPAIDKIDPPDWWADMPSPMLLIHGEYLSGARISVAGHQVSIQKTQVSDNGHWAFLWLSTANASPQTIHITAANSAGKAEADFQLHSRRPKSDGFQGFSSADVMYLIMTDRFADGDSSNDESSEERAKVRGWHGGDFKGIEQHIDYLQSLGVTTVWTTPVYKNIPSPQSYHGYSATDMYAVDPHFGTLADYQHLASSLHQHRMKIVLDTVPNHIGPAHPWVKDPPLPDWFHGTLEHHTVAKGDFKSIPDPHASWRERRDITEGWFANVLPDLNQENPIVAKYLIQNAVWWIETAGLDGLRIDTFPYVNRAFWQQFHAQLRELYPKLTTVGEVFNGDPTITSYFAGGVEHNGIDTGLYTPFDFPLYFTLRSVLVHGEPITKLEDILRQDRLYPHPERLVTFLGNHDTARFLSEPGATPAELKMAFGLLATLRGMPQIYAGDEIAMRGGNDPDNRHDFPGGFHDGQPNAFEAASRSTEQQEMYSLVSTLLHLRTQHSILQSGEQQDVLDEDPTAFAFVRAEDISHGCDGKDRVLVIANNADQLRNITLNTENTALAGCSNLRPLAGVANVVSANHDTFELHLGAKEVAFYSAD
ncbi:cyclomaltodextrinase N-terminal domain-containing protein [Alloacidobacterium dinghuense]|uniref:Cyclomaltodextrinase N-terminal domain-containing protein n=1 Tax=Alloacidobacterium dinghuense TaxID=2763107 RepID=A0A7G8BDP7_9BACT|nr:alpha-amylase family glycosyl hydrolase [Alloacidobacterium dinghuense]QNI30667.1 cyclomaltodextrinase N-terminal domain-containing protein [Alloacidobacterium dinghuense]